MLLKMTLGNKIMNNGLVVDIVNRIINSFRQK